MPDSRIAKYPLEKRDDSKLLIWENGNISENVFSSIVDYLPELSQLIFNNTKVIHARLLFRKETGAKIELFCLEPVAPADYQVAFQQTKQVTWRCMVGNAKKWKNEILSRNVIINHQKILFQAKKIGQTGNTFFVEFNWDSGISFAEIIVHAGILPIPPYLNRETEESDETTYQTVYAKIDGSVAAPTAGLHFTDEVFSNLSEKNISTQEITLHVGAGTFQPVKSEEISGHNMHHEKVIFPKSIIQKFIQNPENIIAVGTTSVRSIESLYWLGLQLENNTFNSGFHEVKQWEPYENESLVTVHKALQNLIDYLEKSNEEELQFSTQIIIVPGYEFKLIRGIITNFHQPQSTLLLLIAAFLGEDWEKVYDYALNNNFRFLSYGDSNLYLK